MRIAMLQDKDRIFTNLYGMHDRTLAGAKARGHWDGTKDLIGLGRDWIVDIMKASRPARSWRRGLSPPASSGRSCPRNRTGGPATWW
jgi:NADH:ubiquinone oxidoreductase subunit F (NADH-binding)